MATPIYPDDEEEDTQPLPTSEETEVAVEEQAAPMPSVVRRAPRLNQDGFATGGVQDAPDVQTRLAATKLKLGIAPTTKELGRIAERQRLEAGGAETRGGEGMDAPDRAVRVASLKVQAGIRPTDKEIRRLNERQRLEGQAGSATDSRSVSSLLAGSKLDPKGTAREQQMRARQAEIERRRQASAQFKAEKNAYNSEFLARADANGVQFRIDPATGLYREKMGADGEPLYHETAWKPTQHPETGLTVMQRRNGLGQLETKRPNLKPSEDPTDEYLYADLGDGASEKYMKAADAAASPDVGLRKVGAMHMARMKREARRQELDEPTSRLKQLAMMEDMAKAEESNQKNEIARISGKIAELSEDAQQTAGGFMGMGAAPTPKALAAQQQTLALEKQLAESQAKLTAADDALKGGGQLNRRKTLAGLDVSIIAPTHKRDEYADMMQVRQAMVEEEGGDIATDPTYQNYAANHAEWDNAVKLATAKKKEWEGRISAIDNPIAPKSVAATPEKQEPGFISEFGKNAGDAAASFASGAGSALKMVGDIYGLATGDMQNPVSNFGKDVSKFWDEKKTPEFRQLEQKRQAAIQAEKDEKWKAWAYFRETFSNPTLLAGMLAENIPNMVGPGALGAVSRAGAAKLLVRKLAKDAAAKQATKIGLRVAVGAGAAMQGADVASNQYDETIAALDKMTPAQAAEVPDIAELMQAGVPLDEAKLAFALSLARKTFVPAAAVSVTSQMVPGAQSIEKALVGGATKRVGSRLAGAGVAALGEVAQENIEELGGLASKNIIAKAVEPGRDPLKDFGQTAAQATIAAGLFGAASGAVNADPSGGIGNPMSAPAKGPSPETTAANAKAAATMKAAFFGPQATVNPNAGLEETVELGGLTPVDVALSAFNRMPPPPAPPAAPAVVVPPPVAPPAVAAPITPVAGETAVAAPANVDVSPAPVTPPATDTPPAIPAGQTSEPIVPAAAPEAPQPAPAATNVAQEPISAEPARVAVDDEAAINAQAEAQAAPLAGERIDKEWVAFQPEATLGIPRAEMPQVKSEARGALVNFLKARGISAKTDLVNPADIKPTQAEFSPVKVEKAANFKGSERPILISADNRVVDGHHQWLAKLDSNAPQMPVIRLEASIQDVLAQMKEFPSAETAKGAAPPTQPVQENAQPIQEPVQEVQAEAPPVVQEARGEGEPGGGGSGVGAEPAGRGGEPAPAAEPAAVAPAEAPAAPATVPEAVKPAAPVLPAAPKPATQKEIATQTKEVKKFEGLAKEALKRNPGKVAGLQKQANAARKKLDAMKATHPQSGTQKAVVRRIGIPKSGERDILNAIADLGGIAHSESTGGEYNGFSEATKTGLAQFLVKRDGRGSTPDQIIGELKEQGFDFDTPQEMYDEIKQAMADRDADTTSKADESKADRIAKSLAYNKKTYKRMEAKTPVQVDDLRMGDKMNASGKPVVVKSIDEEGNVTIESEGVEQVIPAGGEIFPDRRTYRPVSREVTDFASAPEPAPAAKAPAAPLAPEPKAGKEFAYGLRSRPWSIGAQPKGQSRIDEEDKRARYGVAFYPRELTKDEIASYELVDLNAPAQEIILESATNKQQAEEAKAAHVKTEIERRRAEMLAEVDKPLTGDSSDVGQGKFFNEDADLFSGESQESRAASEEELSDDPFSLSDPTDTAASPEQHAAAQTDLDAWQKANLQAPKVVLVNDPSWLRNGRGVKGQYRNGVLTVNTAYATNVAETANHEWAHDTLASERGKVALATFAQREIPAADMNALAQKYPRKEGQSVADHRLELVEEWVAKNAEKSPGVWQRIVDSVRGWLARNGMVTLTNDEAARAMMAALRKEGATGAQGDAERLAVGDAPVEPKTKESLVSQSLREKGFSVSEIEYLVRNQEEVWAEAEALVSKHGAKKVEDLVRDRTIKGDVRGAIAGVLMVNAKGDTAEMNRLARLLQSNVSTESGQAIAMHAKVYEKLGASATPLEYTKRLQEQQQEKIAPKFGENPVAPINQGLAESSKEATEAMNEILSTSQYDDKDLKAKKLTELGVSLEKTKAEMDRIRAESQYNDKELNAKKLAGLEDDAAKIQAEMDAILTAPQYRGKNPKVAADLLESHGAILNVLRDAAREKGIRWSDLFQSVSQNQAERKAELFKRVREHPKLQNLTDEQAKLVADKLEEAWTQLRDNIFKQEFVRLVPMQNVKPADVEKVKGVVGELIRYHNLGLLDNAQFLNALAEKYGIENMNGPTAKRLSELAQQIQEAKTESEKHRLSLEMLREYHKAQGVKVVDYLQSLMYANILSGYTTLTGGMAMPNLMNSLWQMGTMAAGAVASGSPTQATTMAKGYAKGLGEGWEQFKSIVLTGHGGQDPAAVMAENRGDVLEMAAIGDAFPKLKAAFPTTYAAIQNHAKVLRYVGRTVRAIDALAYYPAREAYTWAATEALLKSQYSGAVLHSKVQEVLGIRPGDFAKYRQQATAEGFEGYDLSRRISDLIEEHRKSTAVGAEGLERGKRFGLSTTLSGEPEGYAGIAYRGLSKIVNTMTPGGVPVLKPFFMFLRVPTNFYNMTMNTTPLGALRAAGLQREGWKPTVGAPRVLVSNENGKKVYRNLTADEKNQLYVQSVVGTALMGYLAAKALAAGPGDDWWITANGPRDPAARAQWQANGGFNHSIKLPGTKKAVGFANSPLAVPLAIVANVADSMRYDDTPDQTTYSRITNALMRFPSVVFGAPMLNGLSQLADLTNSYRPSTKKAEMFFTNMGKSMVMPRLVSQVDQTIRDDTVKDGDVTRYDSLGEPVRWKPYGRMINTVSADPLRAWLDRAKIVIPTPGRDIKLDGRPHKLTDKEFSELEKLAGGGIKSRLRSELPMLRTMPRDAAETRVHTIAREQLERARTALKSRRVIQPTKK